MATNPQLTPAESAHKGRGIQTGDRSSAQAHPMDLCRMLGEPTPHEADPIGEWFAFEKGAGKLGGGEGFADVWKRGFFAWEYKSKGKDLKAAYRQLVDYKDALENPPILVVSDKVSRYASIEQRMFETKDAYYDAIYASQRRWREGEHDIWPWTGYLVGVLVGAYDDFEARVVGRRNLAVGSKQDQVRRYILDHAPAVFRLRDVRSALPGISDPTIRRVLSDLRRAGAIELVDGRASGRRSAWRRRTHGADQ